MPLAQHELANRSDQDGASRQTQLCVEPSGGRARGKALDVDAVVDNVRPLGVDPLRNVILSRRVRNRDQAAIAVQIGDGLTAQPDDVAKWLTLGSPSSAVTGPASRPIARLLA